MTKNNQEKEITLLEIANPFYFVSMKAAPHPKVKTKLRYELLVLTTDAVLSVYGWSEDELLEKFKDFGTLFPEIERQIQLAVKARSEKTEEVAP